MKTLVAALMLATAALDAQDGGPIAPAKARRDGGASTGPIEADPDRELIDNLDALERMELLENIELFDGDPR